MTKTHDSKFRIAGGLLAGLTIGLSVTVLAAAPAAAESAADLSPWTVTHSGPSPDATVDAADYVVWRKTDGTAVIGDPVTFTFTVTNSS
jgi:hypothetical protein